jgi:protein-S-isoprenylcysteine O-methyltransferase Ste14
VARISMRKTAADAGTLAFFVLAPFVVAVLVRWWLANWQTRHGSPDWLPGRLVGVVLLVAASSLVLVLSFVRFVMEGAGRPAPVAPTEQLVVGGFYRHVRNPMYIAVVALITDRRWRSVNSDYCLYAATVLVACATFVHADEEPILTRRFGARYETYRSAVPAWWPRPAPMGSGQSRRAVTRGAGAPTQFLCEPRSAVELEDVAVLDGVVPADLPSFDPVTP